MSQSRSSRMAQWGIVLNMSERDREMCTWLLTYHTDFSKDRGRFE
jgi:hypothetical protein